VWRRIAASIGPAHPVQRRAFTGSGVPARWLAVAATLVLALGIGEAVLWRTRLRQEHRVDAARVMREIATTKGQRAEVKLGDGSKVILGVASRLRFPADLGAGARELELEGSAYFEVVHDSARPFLVRTANAVAEDLGTRFVVTAYPENRSTQVVVAEGRVALAGLDPRAERTPLAAGELGQLADGDPAPKVRRVNPAQYTAWTQGELVFRDSPLSNVVAELRRWYDVDLRVGDSSIANVLLTASFNAESLDEALTYITTVMPVRTARTGRHVTLYRRSDTP
jgi:transmembrane sensor